MAGNYIHKNRFWTKLHTTKLRGSHKGPRTLRIHWIQRCINAAAIAWTLFGLSACEGDEPPNHSTVEMVDPLSMPASPIWSPEEFQSAKNCAVCHKTHYDDWSTSMHAYATKDPVWRALVKRMQDEKDGKSDRFCAQCHSPIGTRAGEFDPNFNFEDLSLIASEGVTCEGCHKVTSVDRIFNAGHKIDPNSPMRGPIMQPAPGSPHLSMGDPIFDTSEFCGSCHDVKAPNDLMLEEVFAEWSLSPSASIGENCQDCHMPSYLGKAADIPGVPERELHSHRFVGVGTPLSPDFLPNQAEKQRHHNDALAMLQKSAKLTLKSPSTVFRGAPIPIEVMIKNTVRGHSFPTGSAFNRQLWLEVLVLDAVGTKLFHTGYLDENLDLADTEDAYLRRFDAKLIDSEGEMTIFPWEAVHVNNRALKPGEMRSTMFMIPTRGAIGPLTITVSLKFRQLPPYMLRELGLDHLLPELHVLEVAGAQTQTTLEDAP